MTEKTIPAPFTLSPAAIKQIERIRDQYLAFSPDDPPVMPGVNLARRLFDDGSFGPERVVIGFWRVSEFPASAYDVVQRVSGVDLVFPVPPEDRPPFAGKQIDYSDDSGFYLRDGAPA